MIRKAETPSGRLRKQLESVAGNPVSLRSRFITTKTGLPRLVEALSQRPAAILGSRRRPPRPGAPAGDFVVVDPHLSWTIEDAALRSRSKNSPFEHRTLEGRAVETIVAGRTVYAYAA
ncbi:MAG: hypothetical protein U1E15_06215 [Hyphomicrobiales bacterium]